MGLFDFFMNEEKKIQRHQRRVTNRDAQAEDREASAVWLTENASPKALYSLLTRFDVNLTQSLNDQAEKEFVFGLLVKHGEAVGKPLRSYLKKCRQIAWPVRLFNELFGEQATIEFVYVLLAHEHAKDDFKADKKRELLVWLAEHPHPDRIKAVVPLLEDFDEGVRYAAAEVIIAQGEEASKAPLLKLITDPKEESNRLKSRVCDVFATRRWPVDPEAILLPPNYAIDGDRITPI